jgi:hypothetical protein
MKCIVLTSEGLSVSLGFSFCSGKEMLSTAELLDELTEHTVIVVHQAQ